MEDGLTQLKPAEVVVAGGLGVAVGNDVAGPVSVEEGDGIVPG